MTASEAALEIYQRVLAAVRGDRLVAETVRLEGDAIRFQGRADGQGWTQTLSVPLRGRRVRIAGAGKASTAMARGLLERLDGIVSDGLVVGKRFPGEEPESLGNVRVVYGNHPIPGEDSLAAGRGMLEFAASCWENDLVLFCLSGGASALLEDLPDDVSLDQLRRINERALASAATIGEINQLRRQVSNLKGGKLAARFGGAQVICLVLSDVEGNDLRTIGSAPLVAPGIPHILIGDRQTAQEAASTAARDLGFEPVTGPRPLEGEARARAESFAAEGLRRIGPGQVGIATGECVVKVQGDGRGGRAQEFAMAASAILAGHPSCAVLCGSTDGTDGPWEYAGGIVDGESVLRAFRQGCSLAECMARNDSERFLRACGGLLRTGSTGSNVNDLALFVRTA